MTPMFWVIFGVYSAIGSTYAYIGVRAIRKLPCESPYDLEPKYSILFILIYSLWIIFVPIHIYLYFKVQKEERLKLSKNHPILDGRYR